MKAQGLTRTRKQQRPPREVTVLTRSKSQFVGHQNADIHCSLPDQRKHTRRSSHLSGRGSFPCSREDGVSRISIKDLRARRVFSDPMVVGEIGFGVNGDGGSRDGFVGEEEGVQCPRKGDEEKVDSGIADELMKEGLVGETPLPSLSAVGTEIGLDYLSPNLRVKGTGDMGSHEPKLKGNRERENKSEENVQTTPPFLEQRGYEKAEVVGVDRKEDAVVFPLPECDPSFDDCRNHCGSPLWKDRGSTRKMVLKPWSRLKVYKSPNSFSYRRLLPFLMDLEKERSCVVQTINCPKSQKCLKETPQQQLPVSAHNLMNRDHDDAMEVEVGIPGCVSHVTYSDAHKEKKSFSEHNVDSTLQHSVTRAPFDSSYNDNQSNLVLSSDKPGNMDSGLDKVSTDAGPDQTTPQYSPAFVLAPSPAENALNGLHDSSDCFGDKSSKEGLELLKTQNPVDEDQTPTNVGVVFPSEQRGVVYGKGILKRNPRGCRGLCNCLDCCAFRLHADRAFEFSRNQLQAAEEVALYLIKELSELRNTLGKSVGNPNSDAIVSINQVKEACMKAFEAEEVTRDRLSQMNEDLYVHCRTKALQRPRVNFASVIEEEMAAKGHIQ